MTGALGPLDVTGRGNMIFGKIKMEGEGTGSQTPFAHLCEVTLESVFTYSGSLCPEVPVDFVFIHRYWL